jgi:hypothetical protein
MTFRCLRCGLLAAIFALGAHAEVNPNSPSNLKSLPRQGGLPVNVLAGVSFAKIDSVGENEGEFNAMIDVRLRWRDSRLKATANPATGFQEFHGQAASAKLSEIWAPVVDLANLRGEPLYQNQVLRLFSSGHVEWMRRTTGSFSSEFQVGHFPFDRQKLTVELVVRGDPSQRVTLDFRQGDLDFSRAIPGTGVPGWKLGWVDMRRSTEIGFHGESHAALAAELEIAREFNMSLGPIFIPLFASLLIPLMAIYLNRIEDGKFQIEAFELSNIVIGGLFAVIALNFTVNSEYPGLGGSDNPVTQLFTLNYLALGIALAIIIVLFRFGLVQRAFGKYVQEQLYLYIVWAAPLVVLATAVAILLASAAS